MDPLELEAELQSLQAEVTELQKQLQEKHKAMTFDFRGNLLQALEVLLEQGELAYSGQRVALLLQEELKEMEEDVEIQTQINGFNVEQCSVRRVSCPRAKAATGPAGGASSTRKVCVSGRCSDLEFQMDFDMTELKFGETTKRTVTDLNIVMKDQELQSLGSFLPRAEETKDLLSLFRTLKTFTKRCDERRRTFSHFQVRLS